MAVLGVLVLAGCKDDLRAVTTEWNASAAQWQTKIDGLKKDDAEQTPRFTGLCSTEGLDPGNVAAKTCADLEFSAQSDKEQLDVLGSAITRNRAVVDEAIARGKRLEVSVAIDAAKTELVPMIARANDNAELRREGIKRLQAAVTQEFEAAKAAALASEAKAQLWRQAANERKPLDLTDIRFTKGTSELEAAEAGQQTQLQELVVWANNCPSLSFSITAHESRELAAAEAKKLTDGRAAAVKKFLIDHGVAASKIVTAVGAGAKKLVADEPDPLSEAAKTMNPEDLEALRNKNRRITVEAVTVCAAAERAELN